MRANSFPYLEPHFAAMAHRGGSLMADNLARENTLHAFANAVELGFRYIETDVHASADGVLIAFHDDDLSRVTGEPGTIATLPWSSLREVLVGGAEPIPTMDQVFETFPDLMVNIDIKSEQAVAPLAAAIRRHGAEDRVCVASFSAARLRQFRKLAGPRVATAAGPNEIAMATYIPKALPLRRSRAVAWQMPLRARFLGREWNLLNPRLLNELHRLGKRVHIWTIDDAQTMHDLIDAGVDGIVTDRPDTLREVMFARGMWYT